MGKTRAGSIPVVPAEIPDHLPAIYPYPLQGSLTREGAGAGRPHSTRGFTRDAHYPNLADSSRPEYTTSIPYVYKIPRSKAGMRAVRSEAYNNTFESGQRHRNGTTIVLALVLNEVV